MMLSLRSPVNRSWSDLVFRLFNKANRKKAHRVSRPAPRLSFEHLEDRVVPATTITITTGIAGTGSLDAFLSVAVPLARPGFVVAGVLAFAHTIGEFGVVLMIGGGIPGQTEVLSIEIYKLVEALEWDRAHLVAAGLLAFAFAVVLSLLLFDRRAGRPRT